MPASGTDVLMEREGRLNGASFLNVPCVKAGHSASQEIVSKESVTFSRKPHKCNVPTNVNVRLVDSTRNVLGGNV